MRRKVLYYMITVFLFSFSHLALSQEVKINADSLLKVATILYQQNDNVRSVELSQKILNNYPDYTDVKILLARNYMVQSKYDDARTVLDEVLKTEPQNYDAHTAIIDLNYWSKKYEACVLCSNSALDYYPADTNFIQRKNKCIKESQTRMMSYSDALKETTYKNKLSVAYVNDYAFNDIPTSHLAYIEYARQMERATLVGRFNYANRWEQDGYQVEADAWLKTTPGSYAYLNAGVSDNTVFPKYRAGAEYYQALPNKFEVSLGARYLFFDPDNVFIYTLSGTKYIDTYMFSARTYVTPNDSNTAVTGLFTIRCYTSDVDFYGIQFNLGVDPDLNSNIATSGNYYINTVGVRVEYRKTIAPNWQTTIYAGYERQEYLNNQFRDVVTAHIILSYLF